MTTTSTPSLKQVMADNALFASTFLRILNKDKRLVPLRYNKAQQHYNARMTKRDINLKARQLGMTTKKQGDLFKYATTSTCTTLTLTHLDATTQALRRMSDRFYENIPHPFPKPLRAYANATVTTYADTGSECIIATAGSKDSARGLTVTHAHLSEVAFWKDADEVMMAVLQSIPESGTVMVESTPNGQQGWFYETCMGALTGENDWRLHFYPWWWDEGYRIALDEGEALRYEEDELQLIDMHDLTPEQIKWRRKKVIELKELFLQEYPESVHSCFLSGDGTAVFRNVRELATAKIYVDAEHYRKDYPKARFVMGVDFGREQDFSVFTVMDASTWTVVDVYRVRHLDWHIQRARLKAMSHQWDVERIIAESNSMGGPNISALMQENLPVEGFTTTAKSKKAIIDNLTMAMEQRDIRLLPDTGHDSIGAIVIAELMGYQQKKTASGNYIYEGKPHDDCVMSLAFTLLATQVMGAF